MNRQENQARSYLMIRLPVKWIAFFILRISLIAGAAIAGDELTNPTGLEIGANGDIYISNKGFVAGQGEVLRLSLEQETCFNQATVNGAAGRWSGLLSRSHLLGDQGAFDYVYNMSGNLDPNVSVISRTSLS